MKTAEQIREQIDSLQVYLEKLENLPEDDYPNGAVIRFQKRFGRSRKLYSYAAIKAVNRWYVTGNIYNSYAWQDLLLWMEPEAVETIEWASEWSR